MVALLRCQRSKDSFLVAQPVELLIRASSVAAAEEHDVVVAANRFEVLRVAAAVGVAGQCEVLHAVDGFN